MRSRKAARGRSINTYTTSFCRMAEKPKNGRPRSDNPKVFTSLRLDAEVVAHFKAGGKGWQTRINDALKQCLVAKAG
ncbi:MAG: BrnA antitoxin family protein [Methyloglobulus sp.]|nr:BrnA antitoxin family protein [Methyloglobulus sp.]